ncbi:hypothetical protein KU893_18400 [Nocardioides daeguensis]|nr:hypothetical protein [Nocardioides daeguensis]
MRRRGNVSPAVGAAAPSPEERWVLGERLSGAHRERLAALGVTSDLLDRLDLRAVDGPLPPWWARRGNALYVTPGLPWPADRIRNLTELKVSNALVVLASDIEDATWVRLHGDDATFFVGPGCLLPQSEIHCHAGSAIVLTEQVTCTCRGQLDARNGGRIVAHPDQLWASDVLLATDDMHRLQDAETGARINGYGGVIELGRHVWLGRDAVVTGNVTIGEDSVVGMRSLVRNRTFEAGTAIAGTPGRAVRTGVTWTREDAP